MSQFFSRYSLILVAGNQLATVRTVSRNIRLTYKPDAVIAPFIPSMLTGLNNVPGPFILYQARYAIDEAQLQEVRQRSGLIVWICRSRFMRSDDLYIHS